MQAMETSICQFLSDEANFGDLKEIARNKKMQPRLLDYFICQHSKDTPQLYRYSVDGENCGLSDVYSSYKLQLKGYHKRWFNIFSKSKLVRIVCKDEVIEMPMARANVYKWLIITNIHKLILAELPRIQNLYCEYRKNNMKRKKLQGQKRGRMQTFIKTPMKIHMSAQQKP